MASPRDSPASDVPSDRVLGMLSVRDKTLLKRNINKHHNNNLGAGYVPVDEDYLHKTGLRGRKIYLFWIVIVILIVLAIANLMLLLIIFSILRIGLGMESLEVIADHSLIKFYGRTDLGRIMKKDGILEGFSDVPLTITGDNSQLIVDVTSSQHEPQRRVMILDENEVLFQNIRSFEVKHPKTGKVIFSTKNPSFRFVKGVRNLHVDHVTTSRISSPVGADLALRSDSYIRFKGNEGTTIEGKHMFWSADQFLFLKSGNGSIIFNGTKGVTVDMTRMPIAANISSDISTVSQYKICVCMPSGKLFRVKVHPSQSSQTACDNINMAEDFDPCKIS